MQIGITRALLLSGFLAIAGVGCGPAAVTATVPLSTLGGYGVVGVSALPYGIYDYPSVYWNGAFAYLVGSSWYYPTASGWVVFQEEPPELYRYRRTVPLQTAPPARQVEVPVSPSYRVYPSSPPPRRARPPRTEAPVQVAPPAPRDSGQQMQSAPPAPRGSGRQLQSAPPRR